MATCEVCGAVYPTNGLRGAIHEPSACRDVLAARVAEEQTAHATLRALWDARCGTIASVQARLTEAEERLEAAEWVVEAARALESAVLIEAGARESMHAPRAVLSATLTHRADVLAALDAAASSRAEGLAPIVLHVTPHESSPAPRCEHGWPLPGHSFVAKCQACRIAALERAAMAARVVVDSFARDEWSTADEELDAALRRAGF